MSHGDAFRLLTARGFTNVESRKSRRSFEGNLLCEKGNVLVRISIFDWNFLTYPAIRILDAPSFLPPLMPHIDVHGRLCYFSPGAVTLDRYAPDIAIAQCLDQATALLNRISKDPDYRHHDIQNEFLAHWEFGQVTPTWPVLLMDVSPESHSAHYYSMEFAGEKRYAISDDEAAVSRMALAFGATITSSKCQCWLFKTARLPAVPEKMPGTIKELFIWLKAWDSNMYSGIQSILASSEYLNNMLVTFAIDTPIGWLGFGFEIDQMAFLKHRRKPKEYRNFLHNKGSGQPLLRLSIQEIGGGYVHSRNLTFPDLHNKRITIIGCGAIGSFTSDALVRLGAGTGKLGTLKLIDIDRLGPENLGRHVLGYPSLFKPKASALAAELRRKFPAARIDSIVGDVFEDQNLFAAELIIDATGEESVSEYLNGLRLVRRTGTPVLHIWIRGNGDAVQALWTDDSGFGCYRCMLVPDAKHHRVDRFRILKTDAIRRTDGCRAYTPYAVSAPMHAAALAADMVCSWLQGDVTPRFRTRSAEHADLFKVRNQDIPRLKECPACGQR